MAAGMSRREPLFDPEAVFTLPATPSSLPLFADACAAGFPSPAGDYVEQELDLNSLCIRHPAATYFLRASGERMNLGLYDGDILVVTARRGRRCGDCGSGRRVKAAYPRPALEPMNPAYPTLWPEELTLFGVVMHFIHRTRARL
jgi:DNA polymerase V